MASINHLKIFCTVVECGSMSKAAEQLFVAQSSVSRRISELEEEYDVLLFERLNRRLYLTAHGRKLHDLAVQLVSAYDNLDHEMCLLKEESKLIRIGTTPSFGTSLLSIITTQFKDQQPDIKLDVGIFGNQSLYRRLLANDLDLAITDRLYNKSKFECFPFVSERLVLVCGEQHPFYHRTSIRLEELNQQPFVHRELTSGTRTFVDELFATANIHVQSAWMSNNIQALINMLLNNNALTIISRPLVQHELETSLLHEVDIDGMALHRTYNFYYHKDSSRIHAIRLLLESVQLM